MSETHTPKTSEEVNLETLQNLLKVKSFEYDGIIKKKEETNEVLQEIINFYTEKLNDDERMSDHTQLEETFTDLKSVINSKLKIIQKEKEKKEKEIDNIRIRLQRETSHLPNTPQDYVEELLEKQKAVDLLHRLENEEESARLESNKQLKKNGKFTFNSLFSMPSNKKTVVPETVLPEYAEGWGNTDEFGGGKRKIKRKRVRKTKKHNKKNLRKTKKSNKKYSTRKQKQRKQKKYSTSKKSRK